MHEPVATLHDGMCFGEAALLNKSNARQATIRCASECFFGTLSKESFEATVALIQQNIINKKVALIQRSQRFANENHQVLCDTHYFWKPVTFYRDQLAYRQGQQCEFVYLILRGEFEQEITRAWEPKKELDTAPFTGPSRISYKSNLSSF